VPADELTAQAADGLRRSTIGERRVTTGGSGDGRSTIAILHSGEVEVLGRMPWSSNATLLVDVRCGGTGLRAVYKPRRGERPLWDFPAGLDRREVAAYELSAWLGWNIVPETVQRDEQLPFGVGSLQRFVSFDAEQHYFTLLEDPARHDALRTIGCFDLLANSADRKGGHCLAGDDGRLWAVDNGLTFHRDRKLRTVIWDFAGEPVPDHLLAGVRRLSATGGPASLAELLDPAEREALVARATAVVAAGTFPFDHTGRCYPWPLV
jgi:uncharacterized repeat protein (TIGR03843 family)